MPDTTLERKKEIVLLILALLFSLVLAFLFTQQPTIRIRSDHFSRWYATHMLVTEHRSLYDHQNGREIVALNNIPVDPVEGSFFYPAYLMIFTLPLAWLPYFWAHFIWLTFIQALLILGIWLLHREIHWPKTTNQFTLFLFLSLLFIPNFQNTIWGQFNTIAFASLVMVYLALRRGQYFIAGILATGMMFKPQQMLLTVAFLLVWSLLQKKRRYFFGGFSLGMIVLWLFANLLEPDWLSSFLVGLRAYSGYLHPEPAIRLLGHPGFVIWSLISIFVFLQVIKHRDMSPDDLQFVGYLILSLGIWWLLVPVLGMLHLTAAPFAILLLMASLERMRSMLYKFSIEIFLALYAFGLLGFFYGLSSPDLYGLHIRLAELVYKFLAPIVLVLLTYPLVSSQNKNTLKQSKSLLPPHT